MRQNCSLQLSNGQTFQGQLIGAPVASSGELVFTTGMVGYSEAITDPSYYGQILSFTYPLIGNYGIPEYPEAGQGDLTSLPTGFESRKPQAAGVLLSVDSLDTFHWRSFQSLDQWLKDHGVPGIVGVDTRHIVHTIRSTPQLLGRIEPEMPSNQKRYEDAFYSHEGGFFDPGSHEIINAVSTTKRQTIGSGSCRIAVLDCGIKWNIVRQLLKNDCQVELLPWNSDITDVQADGWLISNGPGDPTRTGDLRHKVRQLFDSGKPLLGICLGHQMVCLAAGATTVRMPYGHRSHNQPVYEVGTRRGYMTTQNHGYVVVDHSLPESFEPWFRNANDQSIEGVKHKDLPIYSVQFHPESAGGPRDTGWIIEQFVERAKG